MTPPHHLSARWRERARWLRTQEDTGSWARLDGQAIAYISCADDLDAYHAGTAEQREHVAQQLRMWTHPLVTGECAWCLDPMDEHDEECRVPLLRLAADLLWPLPAPPGVTT